jgi:beta-mannosidase
MLSAKEEGFITQGANVNSQPFEYEKSVTLCLANETLSSAKGVVRWQLRKPDSSIAKQGEFEAATPPLESVWFDKLDFPDADMRSNYVSYSFEANGEALSSGTVLFCPPKHFNFVDPKLAVSEKDGFITVKASAYARSVEIKSEDGDLLLSDNYFDLNAEGKTVKVLGGAVSNLRVRSVYDIR